MDPLDSTDTAHLGIREILADPSLRGARFIQAIEAIGSRSLTESFRLCLRALAGLDLPDAEARAVLAECDRHRDRLEIELGRDPGLGVAVADHLQLEAASCPTVVPAGPGAGGASSSDSPDRAFLTTLEAELLRAERFDRDLAVALLSPDTDDPGAILRRGLAIAREVARDTDALAALGPDRVAVLFPCTGEEGARLAAARLSARLAAMTGTTWSVGISEREDGPGGTRELLQQAAASLSVARSEGGGTVRAHRRERRAHPRRLPGGTIIGRVRSALGSEPVDLEDLSLGGARFVGASDLATVTEVVLSLSESTALPRRIALTGRIIRSRFLADRSAFEAALRFSAGEHQRYGLAGILADLGAVEKTPAETNG